MRRFAPVVAALAALLLGACRLATDAGSVTLAAGLSVRAGSGELVLSNRLAEPIHYVAVEAETATRIDLYFDPSKWPAVAPGATTRLPYREVTGYAPGARDAVIYLWSDGGRHDRLQVRLR